MKRDPHTNEEGKYKISSLYFDNYTDKALKEKANVVQKRDKYRSRWYNDSKASLTLEKKMKVNNLCMKFGTKITEEQYQMILDKNYDWMLETSDKLIREFYYRIRQQRLTSKVVVSYIREPYIFRFGNVRITFDSEISTSLAGHNFEYDSVDVPASDEIILEVKYDEYLPGVISDILQLGNLKQNAFSKYMTCRKYG